MKSLARLVARARAGAFVFALAACSTGTGGEDDGAGGVAGAGDSGAGSGAGSPAASGSGGSGAEIDPGPHCDPRASAFRGSEVPNPLISLGASVEASAGVTTPETVVDGIYHRGGANLGTPTRDEPQWIAIDTGGGPARLLLTWADTAYGNYEGSKTIPVDYRIETAPRFSEDASDWEVAVEVEGNLARTGAHAFDFEDRRWVRLVVTAAPGPTPPVVIDEISLYDASEGGSGRVDDSWFFLGDSITAAAFPKNSNEDNFDAQVQAGRPEFFPAYLNGGISGETAADALERLPRVLEATRDLHYLAIGYGTNDSWGNQSVTGVRFEQTMNELVDQALDAGLVPILARIPFANGANASGQDEHATIPDFNAVIDRITAERGLPCGPDLFAWFQAHPDELMNDGVHPTGNGSKSMNRLWAEAALPLYRAE
jgi:lysophospholipase L1-like esterase